MDLFRTPSAEGSFDRADIPDIPAKNIQATKQVKRKNTPGSKKQVQPKKRVYCKNDMKQDSTFGSLQTLSGMDLRQQAIKKSFAELRMRAPNLVDLADFLEADNDKFFSYIDKIEIVFAFWDLLLYLDPDQQYAGWLSDDHINAWVTYLLMKRPENAKYAIMYTYFNEQLHLGRKQLHCANGSGRIKYFPRWTYNTVSLVYLLVVVGKEHWVLLSIDLHSWSVTIYNSLGSSYHKQAAAVIVELEKFFPTLLRNINYYDKVDRPPDMQSFSIITAPDVPKQKNGRDCGVFVCMFLECLSQEKPVTTKTITMTGCQFRDYMAEVFWSGRVGAPPTDYAPDVVTYPGGYSIDDDH